MWIQTEDTEIIPSITNSVFADNMAGYGGGLVMEDTSLVVTECEFINNVGVHTG
ncbi:unnamed protein product, partial [marine sediment metagenome]